MKKIFTMVIIAFPELLFAQQAKALEDNKLELNERYQVLKTNSQTYEDYKVIKEYVLDGFWKIAMDTVRVKETKLADVRQKIATLQGELATTQAELANQKASVEGITFDSTHIAVLGMHFGKGTFLLIIAAVVAAFLFVIAALAARLKILQASVKDKTQVADSLTNEFEAYKRKALERQTKLSRELQNERNKLVELGRG
ncbi:MAG: hypothetical protein KF856_12280 [Cyclobacteriaceae bacterium]|nr:hypothetical protein [Cyclobacteriaceae bacterium]